GRARRGGSIDVDLRRLENELLRVEFGADGLIRRIVDKQVGREVLSPGGTGNRLELYEDRPYNWDAWDVFVYYQERRPEQARLERARVVERGAVRAAMLQEWSLGRSRIRQEVRLTAGSKRIDFVTHVRWQEAGRMLRAAFDVNVRAERATCEIQFGHVDRPTHRNTAWDLARFEVPAQRWVDLSETGYGVALLNDCKYGHGFVGSTMSLNLLRSPSDPDPQADRGEHEFTYALLPHVGGLAEAGVIQAGYELNVPVRAWPTNRHEGPLPGRAALWSVQGQHVVIETVKKCQDDQAVVLRLYEAQRRRGVVRLRSFWPIRRAQVVDLLERPIERLAVDEQGVRLEFRPFEIKTIKLWLADGR
ncbi:MAG: glycoside hydrolase family 38 C-terminal domain-containing protein, partial [Phycisphaerae bacterium]